MPIKEKFQSIVSQLLLAFGIIILLSIVGNSFVYWVTNSIGSNFDKLSTSSLPLVRSNAKLRVEILKSINALEEQIIIGRDQAAQKHTIDVRNEAWNNIDLVFLELKKLSAMTGYSESELSKIRAALDQLHEEQQKISEIANTPDNEPAINLLTSEAIPLAHSMVSVLSNLLELEANQDIDKERLKLFKLLADSRNSFATAISELRAYLLTRNQGNIDDFDQAWSTNTDIFVSIDENYQALFSDKQLALWVTYGKEREKIAPITVRAFEMQSSPKSNFATYHLSQVIEPLITDILTQLETLNAHIVNVSEKDLELMSNSLSNMTFTLILVSVLTILIAGSISLVFSEKLRRRVGDLLARATKLAEGDFGTQEEYFKINSSDEISQLGKSFNEMTLSLSNTISTVKRQSRQVGHSAHQVAYIASDISEVAKSENESYSEVMQVTESFMDLLNESGEAIEQSRSILEHANEQADVGITAVDANISEMNSTVDVVTEASAEVEELKSASEKINKVTEAISNVADQTALIALNAAIEAARAGDQGRGFAVVADEVRNLAQRTANSTDEIKEVIADLLQKVNGVISLMSNIIQQVNISKDRSDESGGALRAMTDTVDKIIQANEQVSQRSTRQTSQMVEMQLKLQQLFSSLKQNSEKAEIVSLIGSDLYHSSEKVNQLMEGFHFDQEDKLAAQTQNSLRRSERIDAKVKLEIEQNGKRFSTVSRELSCVGIGLITSKALNQELEKEQSVELIIYKPKASYQEYNEQSPLIIHGRVRRTEEQDDLVHTYYGIEFETHTANEQQQISELYSFFSN
jgi:methyl-accepting chemotaxis protein